MTELSSNDLAAIDCPHLTGKKNACTICTEYHRLKTQLAEIRASKDAETIAQVRSRIAQAQAAFRDGLELLDEANAAVGRLVGQ